MRFLFTLICTTFVLNTQAADKIHYFDLKHRPANEVIPLIQPLLDTGESISGDGYLLLIKTSTQRKQEIESLVSAIDKAVKTFRISVTNDEYVASQESSIDATVTARTKGSDINVGGDKRENSGVTANIDSRKIQDKSDKTQFVQVQEGKPAFITRDRLKIIPIHSFIQRANGIFQIESSQLLPSKQDGFYVIARSADKKTANVTIQSVSSNRQTYQGYGQDQTYVDTTLQMPLGKWFELGGNTDTRKTQSSGILYRTKKDQQRENKIFIKVDLLH